MYIILVFTISAAICESDSYGDHIQDCLNDLQRFIGDIITGNISTNPQEIFWFSESGKSFNDMGHADTCINYNKGSSYSVIKTMKKDLPYKITYGLCSESNCTASDLNAALNKSKELKDSIASYMSIDSGYSIKDYDFEFGERLNRSIGFVGVCVLLFMVIFIIPQCASCFIWIMKEKPRKEGIREEITFNETDTEVKYRVRSLLDIFNFRKNMNMIFDYHVTSTRPYIRTLDGIKFFLMIGLIFIGDYQRRYGLSMNFANKDYWALNKVDTDFQFMMGGYLISDGYFFIGGTVSTIGLLYVYQHEMRKRSYTIVWMKSIVHKIFRFLPLYILMMLFYKDVIPAISNGPNGHVMDEYTSKCGNWWADSILIGALIYPNEQCMSWTWYIQLDFYNFFVLSLVFLLSFKLKLGNFIMQVLLSIFSVIPMVISAIVFSSKNLVIESTKNSADQILDYRKYFLFSPWTRSTPYFIGAIYGLYYYERITRRSKYEENHVDYESIVGSSTRKESLNNNNNTIIPTAPRYHKFNIMTSYIIPTIGLMIILGTWYIYSTILSLEDGWKSYNQNIFNILCRVSICFGIILICVAEIDRQQYSIFNIVLSPAFWAQFSKVGLSFYLIHLMFIEYAVSSQFNIQLFDHTLLMNYIAGDFYISIFLSFVICIYYEVPFRKIGSYINDKYI